MVAAPDPATLQVTTTRACLPSGMAPATITVAAGRIASIDQPGTAVPARDAVDLGDLVVLPGLVDTHVHVNEPGRTHWEGFETATRAAAAGGVTTIVDMPLNCLPPTTDVAALATKRVRAAGRVFVDTAFWGGAVPDNLDELEGLSGAGVRGFKAFLCDSGVPEYGHVRPDRLDPLLARIAALDSVLIVHAEDPDVCATAAGATTGGEHDPRSHATWVATRPPEAEVAAVSALVAAARRTGARVHVLHLSSADAGEVLADARDEGLAVTVETCPHYLTLASEDVPDGATAFKCAPPIRDRSNQDRLWRLLADGAIDAVVSDHSPCPPEDKHPDSGDFLTAWGGIASLQVGLPVVWTAARARGHGLEEVATWMAAAPAGIARLADKGRLEVGAAGDLVAFDPDAAWTISGEALEHRHAVTPHDGRQVVGRVVGTWLAGRRIADDDGPTGDPVGRLL